VSRGRRGNLRVVDDGPQIVDPGTVAGRVPPMDLDAEAAVLSAILLDRVALVAALDVLKPEHFFSEANARIFQGAQQLAIAETPIDIVTMATWLRDRGWLEKCGGASYLAQIADATPAVGHVSAHAKTVLEKARLRRLIAACQRIAAEGYGDVGEVQPFIDAGHDAIGEIRQAGAGENLDRFAIGEIAAESAAETLAMQSPFEGAFVATGVEPIDAVTGLYPNEVTLLGAPKGLGKTTLARYIADRVARSPRRLVDGRADCDACSSEAPCCADHGRQPRGVLAFALEGTRRDWSDYSAARAARVNLFDRRNGRWTPDGTARFIHELGLLRRVPIAVDDRKDLNRANLGARVRAWRDWFARRSAVLELVIIDYFQIAAWEKGGDSRESDLSDAGRHLIRLATDAESDLRGLSWLVISALNKDGGTRESGALEYHADTFWRLSEGKGADAVNGSKALRLWVEKQRRGPSKVGVSFWFDQARGEFW
jgi:replicative DNA helicase